jgi:hypothetical protein
MGRRIYTDNEYRDKVHGFLLAAANGDDAEMSRLFAEVCDNPRFDAVLSEIAAGDGAPDIDHVGLMHDVLSMASLGCASYDSTTGRALATVQLFFLPLSGPIQAIESIADDSSKLTAVGKSFLDSGLATADSTLVVCGNLIDPLSAATMTAGKLRLALRLITPVLTGRIGEETLGEALSAVFSTNVAARHTLGDFMANRLMPVARIITPADGIIREDALTSYRIDNADRNALAMRRWHRLMEGIAPANVTVGEPCSVMRGRAILATRMIEHVFARDAALLGLNEIPRLDRIEMTLLDGSVRVSGAREGEDYGPVNLPAALFFSDMDMLSDFIDGLADEVAWTDAAKPAPQSPRPH